MLFRLVRPMKRPESSKQQFVQRIPADVQQKARGMTLVIPVGDATVSRRISDRAQVVRISLRTSDPSEAKIRHAEVAAYLEGVWRSLRQGPKRLTHKQVVALSGEVYSISVGAIENDPGNPELWDKVLIDNAKARAGLHGKARLMIGDDARRRQSSEDRFGTFVDVVLGRRGLVVDADSRRRLFEEVARALDMAALRLQQNAKGDFSPDSNLARFPLWEDLTSEPSAQDASVKPSLDDLLEGWWTEARATGRTESTYRSYKHTIELLKEFLRHNDATRVSAEDVVGFKDDRLSQINPRTGKPVSPKTVKDSDLSALKSLFGWAVANRRLSVNPAKGVTIKLGRRVRNRSSYFTPSEAASILRAAAKYQRRPQENPKTASAKRWVPWLCAYTGARVGEMAQLRREDVVIEEGHHCIRITPEAGSVKTKEARLVPVHDHLIEEGFLEFVESNTPGYLFLNVDHGKSITGKRQALKNRLQEFARATVSDAGVQPNHGWRHTFKAIGVEAGIEGRVLDALQGHMPRTEGEAYGGVTVKARARAIARFPRFEVH